MKGFVCGVCKFVSINGSAPDKTLPLEGLGRSIPVDTCPVCGAPKTSFQEREDALNSPKDTGDLTEAEKKHLPVIVQVKECGLIPQGCQDVHVKVGEIDHPMQQEHYIMHIDLYIDNEFISRVILTPAKLNPAAALHLKTQTGKLTVVELCNLHGAWVKEANL